MARLHGKVCRTHNTDYCPRAHALQPGTAIVAPICPWLYCTVLVIQRDKAIGHFLCDAFKSCERESKVSSRPWWIYHSPLYPLKLKATHKETLIKAVSSTEYNERMNYGAMATRSSSSSCCSDERKLTWYRRKTRQVWSADQPCVHISGNLCDENEPVGFWRFYPHGWDLLDFKCMRVVGAWRWLSGGWTVCLHEQAAGRRHGPLLSPARTLKGVAEGALPQHGSDQDLKHSQTQDWL